MWYPYGFRNLSSRPLHLTAPNGLNFSRSVGNPNSRLERVRKYLRENGSRTKAEILREVFGKNITENPQYVMKGSWYYPKNNEVTRGWGSYLFTYGVHHGFFRKERKGNTVLWSVR